MINTEPRGFGRERGTVREFIRYAMRANGAIRTDAETSIAEGPLTTKPRPAFIGATTIHLCPKALCERATRKDGPLLTSVTHGVLHQKASLERRSAVFTDPRPRTRARRMTLRAPSRARVFRAMVLWTKPDHVERLGVVWVMPVNIAVAAVAAGLFRSEEPT